VAKSRFPPYAWCVIFGLSYSQIAWAALAVVGSAALSVSIVAAFLVQLRPDHFVRNPSEMSNRRPMALRVLVVMARNLLGLLLVVVGVLLSLPGVPGQGLLTIFVGLLLLDWPGKRRLLLRLVRRPTLRRTIDRLRVRFDRPPLELDDCSEGADEAQVAGPEA